MRGTLQGLTADIPGMTLQNGTINLNTRLNPASTPPNKLTKITINLQTLNPSLETGRLIVSAIKDYERANGRGVIA
ncbi:hypothetical protein RQN30_10730 [Arcanobacterium hippocoleae]